MSFRFQGSESTLLGTGDLTRLGAVNNARSRRALTPMLGNLGDAELAATHRRFQWRLYEPAAQLDARLPAESRPLRRSNEVVGVRDWPVHARH
jgi:hypothetical protein